MKQELLEKQTAEISAHICQLLVDADEQGLKTLTQDLAAGVLPDLEKSLPTLYTLLTAVAISKKLPKSTSDFDDTPVIDELLHLLPKTHKNSLKSRKVSLERVVGGAANMFVNDNYHRTPKLNLVLESGTVVQGNSEDLYQAFFYIMLGAHENLGRNGSIRVETHVEGDNAVVCITPKRNLRNSSKTELQDTYLGPPSIIPFALASQVINAHGGTLCVKGRQNSGPKVTVTLPCA